MSNATKIVSTKGFYIGGQLQESGKTVEVNSALAADLIARGKATADLTWKPAPPEEAGGKKK